MWENRKQPFILLLFYHILLFSILLLGTKLYNIKLGCQFCWSGNSASAPEKLVLSLEGRVSFSAALFLSGGQQRPFYCGQFETYYFPFQIKLVPRCLTDMLVTWYSQNTPRIKHQNFFHLLKTALLRTTFSFSVLATARPVLPLLLAHM